MNPESEHVCVVETDPPENEPGATRQRIDEIERVMALIGDTDDGFLREIAARLRGYASRLRLEDARTTH